MGARGGEKPAPGRHSLHPLGSSLPKAGAQKLWVPPGPGAPLVQLPTLLPILLLVDGGHPIYSLYIIVCICVYTQYISEDPLVEVACLGRPPKAIQLHL